MNLTFNTHCPYHKRKCKCAYGAYHNTKPKARTSTIAHLYQQIDGFEPFNSFPGDGRLTQELLRWHHVPISQAVGAEAWMTLFATSLLEGWLKIALTNASCYFSYAALIVKLQKKVIGRAASSKREFLFRSFAARHLSSEVGLADPRKWQKKSHEAVAVSISMLLEIAVADGDVDEAGFHAAALRTVCTESLVEQTNASNWLTIWHVATKHAMWLSRDLAIDPSMHHPAFEYDENDFSLDARAHADLKATQLLEILPSPVTSNIDCLTLFSIFRKQFIYTHETTFASSPRATALIGLQHHLQADLCSFVNSLSDQMNHSPNDVDLKAAYAVLATVQLTTYAPFSFSPYSKTVCTVGWSVALVRRLLKVLNDLEDESPFYWNEIGSRPCLTWILFMALAYANLADQTGEPHAHNLIGEIRSLSQRYDHPRGSEGKLKINQALEHFPWFSSCFSSQIDTVQDLYDLPTTPHIPTPDTF